MFYYEDFRKGIPDLLRLRREWKENPTFQTNPDRLKKLLGLS